MHPSLDFIIEQEACYDGHLYVQEATKNGLTDQEIWEDCKKPEWMIWIITKLLRPYRAADHWRTMSELMQHIFVTTYNHTGNEPDILTVNLPYAVVKSLVHDEGIDGEIICNAIRERYPEILPLVEAYDQAVEKHFSAERE